MRTLKNDWKKSRQWCFLFLEQDDWELIYLQRAYVKYYCEILLCKVLQGELRYHDNELSSMPSSPCMLTTAKFSSLALKKPILPHLHLHIMLLQRLYLGSSPQPCLSHIPFASLLWLPALQWIKHKATCICFQRFFMPIHTLLSSHM